MKKTILLSGALALLLASQSVWAKYGTFHVTISIGPKSQYYNKAQIEKYTIMCDAPNDWTYHPTLNSSNPNVVNGPVSEPICPKGGVFDGGHHILKNVIIYLKPMDLNKKNQVKLIKIAADPSGNFLDKTQHTGDILRCNLDSKGWLICDETSAGSKGLILS